jgi:hypothetical protein
MDADTPKAGAVDEESAHQAVVDAMADLPDLEWKVVILRLRPWGGGEPLDFEQIGKIVGVTRERARQIAQRAFIRLYSHPAILDVFAPDREQQSAAWAAAVEAAHLDRMASDPGYARLQDEVTRILKGI